MRVNGNPKEIDDPSLTPLQRSVVQRVAWQIEELSPPQGDFQREEALSELLHCDDFYHMHRNTPLAPYDLNLIRVARGDLDPKNVEEVVSPHAARYVTDPDRWIVKSDAELCIVTDHASRPIKPYWDPMLPDSRGNMREFLGALHRAKLLARRRRARSHIGIFFIQKKDGRLRVVIDGRLPSALHWRPPRSGLAIPTVLSRLILSDEAITLGGDGERLRAHLRGHPSPELSSEPLEVEGSAWSRPHRRLLYQFYSDRLASWFATDFTAKRTEIEEITGAPLDTIWDDDLGAFERPDSEEPLFGCFRGLPMGWSWSLFFGHDFISSCLERELTKLQLPPRLLGDRQAPPIVTRFMPVMAPYVDNANIITLRASQRERVHAQVIKELELHGFTLRDLVLGERLFNFLGMLLDGPSRRLRHTARRTWRLYRGVGTLLRAAGCSGDALAVVVGHLIHHFGLCATALSVLDRVFKFTRTHGPDLARFSPDVRSELVTARGLLFHCGQKLGRPVYTHAYVTDSSAKGYEMLETVTVPREVLEAVVWKEKWRFVDVHEPVADRHPLGLCGSQPAELLVDFATSDLADWRGARRRVAPPLGLRLRSDDEPRKLLELRWRCTASSHPSPGVGPTRWRRIVAGAWKRAGKIHCHGSRVSLMSLRRAAADPRAHGSLVFTIGDNDNLSEILAHGTGRSCDKGLNAHCRQSCALQIAADIERRRCHIESQRNCADHGSRLADAGLLAPGERLAPGGAQQARDRRRAAVGTNRVLGRLELGWSSTPACNGCLPDDPTVATHVSGYVYSDSGNFTVALLSVFGKIDIITFGNLGGDGYIEFGPGDIPDVGISGATDYVLRLRHERRLRFRHPLGVRLLRLRHLRARRLPRRELRSSGPYARPQSPRAPAGQAAAGGSSRLTAAGTAGHRAVTAACMLRP